MKRRKQTVWVIMHYEFMGLPDAPRLDCLQFHVSSSLKMAEKYFRVVYVAPYSWWQVHPHFVDSSDFDEGVEVHYYSHHGTKLKSAPWNRALAAFRKYTAQHPEWYPPKTK